MTDRDGNDLPVEFRLTPRERQTLGLLMIRERAAKGQIMDHLYADSAHEPEIKIIDVYVSKMRKKLTPFGITIWTIWGFGYRLAPDMKAKVRSYMDLAA